MVPNALARADGAPRDHVAGRGRVVVRNARCQVHRHFSLDVAVRVPRACLDRDKQRHVSQFDDELLEAGITPLRRCMGRHNLHPQLMYRALGPFWKDEAGFGLISRFTNHRRLEPVEDPACGSLPDEFIAVRFYFSNCFPEKPRIARRRSRGRSRARRNGRRSSFSLPGHRVDDHC